MSSSRAIGAVACVLACGALGCSPDLTGESCTLSSQCPGDGVCVGKVCMPKGTPTGAVSTAASSSAASGSTTAVSSVAATATGSNGGHSTGETSGGSFNATSGSGSHSNSTGRSSSGTSSSATSTTGSSASTANGSSGSASSGSASFSATGSSATGSRATSTSGHSSAGPSSTSGGSMGPTASASNSGTGMGMSAAAGTSGSSGSSGVTCVCSPLNDGILYVDPRPDAGRCDTPHPNGTLGCQFPSLTEATNYLPSTGNTNVTVVLAPATYSLANTGEQFPITIPGTMTVVPLYTDAGRSEYVIDTASPRGIAEDDGGTLYAGIDLQGQLTHVRLIDSAAASVTAPDWETIILIHTGMPTLRDVEIDGGEYDVLVTADDGDANGGAPTAVIRDSDLNGALVDDLAVFSSPSATFAPLLEAHDNVSIRNALHDGVYVSGGVNGMGIDPTVVLATRSCPVAAGTSGGTGTTGEVPFDGGSAVYCNSHYGVEAVNIADSAANAVEADQLSWADAPPTYPGFLSLNCAISSCDYSSTTDVLAACYATPHTECTVGEGTWTP